MKLAYVIFFLVLVGCASQQMYDNQTPTAEIREPSTALDHPPTDYDTFNEIKKEIDHWRTLHNSFFYVKVALMARAT